MAAKQWLPRYICIYIRARVYNIYAYASWYTYIHYGKGGNHCHRIHIHYGIHVYALCACAAHICSAASSETHKRIWHVGSGPHTPEVITPNTLQYVSSGSDTPTPCSGKTRTTAFHAIFAARVTADSELSSLPTR